MSWLIPFCFALGWALHWGLDVALNARRKRLISQHLRAAKAAHKLADKAAQAQLAHIPAMHEMSMALNRVEGVCECDLCKRYRAQVREAMQ